MIKLVLNLKRNRISYFRNVDYSPAFLLLRKAVGLRGGRSSLASCLGGGGRCQFYRLAPNGSCRSSRASRCFADGGAPHGIEVVQLEKPYLDEVKSDFERLARESNRSSRLECALKERMHSQKGASSE
jgi:hypothetical protein